MPLPQVAEAVGAGWPAEACEALFRRQQAYLSIPKALQSAQAFAALVESANAQREEASAREGAASGGGGGGAAAASGMKQEDGGGEA